MLPKYNHRMDRHMVDILIPEGKTKEKNGMIDPNQVENLAKVNSIRSEGTRIFLWLDVLLSKPTVGATSPLWPWSGSALVTLGQVLALRHSI